jgi:hypothetical protein
LEPSPSCERPLEPDRLITPFLEARDIRTARIGIVRPVAEPGRSLLAVEVAESAAELQTCLDQHKCNDQNQHECRHAKCKFNIFRRRFLRLGRKTRPEVAAGTRPRTILERAHGHCVVMPPIGLMTCAQSRPGPVYSSSGSTWFAGLHRNSSAGRRTMRLGRSEDRSVVSMQFLFFIVGFMRRLGERSWHQRAPSVRGPRIGIHEVPHGRGLDRDRTHSPRLIEMLDQ